MVALDDPIRIDAAVEWVDVAIWIDGAVNEVFQIDIAGGKKLSASEPAKSTESIPAIPGANENTNTPKSTESIPAIPGGNENPHTPKSTESTPTIPGGNENTHTPARQY